MATYRREMEFRRYARLRADAFAAATQALSDETPIPFRLTSIDSRALRVWRTKWVPSYTGSSDVGEWDWDELARDYLRRPSTFHLAIWSRQSLCGLAMGKPNSSRRRLSIEYLEGSPNMNHPLKGWILRIALASGTAYARALGADTLRLSDPVPALIPRYLASGFDLVFLGRAVRYCERRIR
jgi:hypothetical protein